MFSPLIFTFFLANAVVFAKESVQSGAQHVSEPVVVTGVSKLNQALEFMHAQQVLDGKKKAELEAACKGEQTTEAEKQRVSNGKIQENLQKINVLETNLKTYDDQMRDGAAELAVNQAKADSWQQIQARTGNMSDLVAKQRESYHAELDNTAKAVANFVDMIKDTEQHFKAENRNQSVSEVDVTNQTQGTAGSQSSLQGPLDSILTAIASAKNKSLARRDKNSEKSGQFHDLVESKVNEHSAQFNAIQKRLKDLQTTKDQAKTQLSALNTEVDIAREHLWHSRNISSYFDDVCKDYLVGFADRMEQRGVVQKQTEDAISWFHTQISAIVHVIDNLKQAKEEKLALPVQPMPAAVEAPPTEEIENLIKQSQQVQGNIIPLPMQSPQEANIPPNPPAIEMPCGGELCHHPEIYRSHKTGGSQAALTPSFRASRLRYVPTYVHQKDIAATYNTDDSKLKDQKDDLAKQLSAEFDNQLQVERDRLSNAKKAASAVRVGYKMQ